MWTMPSRSSAIFSDPLLRLVLEHFFISTGLNGRLADVSRGPGASIVKQLGKGESSALQRRQY